jgi:hypothetical protein
VATAFRELWQSGVAAAQVRAKSRPMPGGAILAKVAGMATSAAEIGIPYCTEWAKPSTQKRRKRARQN